MDGGHRSRDRPRRQGAPAPAPEPCLHPLFLDHLEAQTGSQARQEQAHRVGTELDEGDDVAGHGLGCYPARPIGTTAPGILGPAGAFGAPGVSRHAPRPNVRRGRTALPL